jgi:predicted metalloprotease with PDZ domain
VKHHRLIPSWQALLVAVALVAAAPAALLAADPPTTSPGAARPDNNSDVEAQLETARRNLEQAAQEVARLSAELSTSAIDEVMPLFEPGRAIIGVQLEPAGGGAAGARVREVSPGGPAAEAGIRTGDVIVAVNGTTLKGEEPRREVVKIMHDVKPDSRVSVRVLRDGKPRDFTLTARASPGVFAATHGLPGLPDLPDVGYAALPHLKGAFMFHQPLMDMELATLTPRLGSYFGSDKGVLVVRAPADGALKLEDGDVILAIGGRQPTSGSHATRILASYQPGEKVTLRILRQHKTLDVEATLPEKPEPMHPGMMRHPGVLPEAPAVQPQRVVIFGNNLA